MGILMARFGGSISETGAGRIIQMRRKESILFFAIRREQISPRQVSSDWEPESELAQPSRTSQSAMGHKLFEGYRLEFARGWEDFRRNAGAPFGLIQLEAAHQG